MVTIVFVTLHQGDGVRLRAGGGYESNVWEMRILNRSLVRRGSEYIEKCSPYSNTRVKEELSSSFCTMLPFRPAFIPSLLGHPALGTMKTFTLLLVLLCVSESYQIVACKVYADKITYMLHIKSGGKSNRPISNWYLSN